jgi:hypothetical protein
MRIEPETQSLAGFLSPPRESIWAPLRLLGPPAINPRHDPPRQCDCICDGGEGRPSQFTSFLAARILDAMRSTRVRMSTPDKKCRRHRHFRNSTFRPSPKPSERPIPVTQQSVAVGTSRSGNRADPLQSLAEGEFMANLKGLASIVKPLADPAQPLMWTTGRAVRLSKFCAVT